MAFSNSSLHPHYIKKCLDLASQSPPKPTNFRVGAILLFRSSSSTQDDNKDKILSEGYTLELPGNTHAEQCCFAKFASQNGVSEEKIGSVLDKLHADDKSGEGKAVLYVTMEPCGKRLSGNAPCVQRIIATTRSNITGGNGEQQQKALRGVDKVYFGVKEPGTFVGQSEGCKMLDGAGIEWELVEGMEQEILKVATAGHHDSQSREEGEERNKASKGTNVDDISEEERKRQEQTPRNPKKRMMEVPDV